MQDGKVLERVDGVVAPVLERKVNELSMPDE